ncbi:DUF3320 domain-containing protein [Chryseobacterium sp. H3056]|uniref:DUF3320 domain-containing protein n=1 Tax=Kaistella daneshvariae TaxID=2487074 RepID=A0A3N0X059_9FLAO|nr:DUF3320 domain-containing protein [Kaistella daneshvariae]ROI10776.1 DUF3320 domain-containing protein [Kaistella daneshvariae]
MTENFQPELAINHAPYFNYTFSLNKYHFLYEIELRHFQDYNENLKITVSSSLGIFDIYNVFVDRIEDGNLKISNFDLNFSLNLLKNLTEKDIDTVTVSVSAENQPVLSKTFSLDILPMDHFGGLQVLPQLLCAYVLPNHPAVYQIKTDAIKIMEANGLSPAFEGYQSGSKERVLQVVSSIYKAIQNLELIYSAMPPSFESSGQRIRLIDQVAASKFGNCIDISLLFAACLEAVDLNPMIIITKGHAFVGVWLEDRRFDSMVNFDQAAISKRIGGGIKEIALVETTTLCRGNNISFSKAITSAEIQLMSDGNFLLSLDVKNSRSNGILPLPTIRLETDIKKAELFPADYGSDLDDPYQLGESYDSLELTDLSNLTKQKMWERKLLDLSLRNSLLNLRFTKSMLQIVDLKINLMEDTLADGKAYTIHPDNNQPVTRKYNNYSGPLHHAQPLFQLADDEFRYNRLLTTYHKDDLDTILTNLYRASKLAEEENGKSTLYLGIGLLKWFDPKNKVTPRLAPILLIPVELSRKSVNSKYMLRSREEETMINITLIEYLKQEFSLNLNALESLPMDSSGVDVLKVLAIVRNAVLNLAGWDVLEQIVLGTFSFNKLILWQDISRYSEEIQKSPIVKSLIDGQLCGTLENVDGNDFELENLPASQLTLPIATDNSQMNAVKNANLNRTFILHGPPGTGKSQTITNIIADALMNNKKVLFVAAKKAALDVVHTRLERIGLGPFCLELHSNKSKKSDVLQQFERTIETPKYALNKDFIEEGKRLDERRKELNKYVSLLHKKNFLNWSLYDSISFLETHHINYDENLRVSVDFETLSQSKWNDWNDWAVPFGSVVAKIGQPKSHPLQLVKIFAHQFEHKNNLVQAIDRYILSYRTAEPVLEKYQIKEDDLSVYVDVLNFINTNKINAAVLDYFFDTDRQHLLLTWRNLQFKKMEVESSVTSKFSRSILTLKTEDLRIAWNQSKHVWFFPKWLKQRQVKKQLQGYATSKIDSEKDINQLFGNLEEYATLQNHLSEIIYEPLTSLSKFYLNNGVFDIQAFDNDLQNAEQLGELLRKSSTEQPQQWVRHNFINQNISKDIVETLSVVENLEKAKKELEQYLIFIPTITELHKIKENIHELELWINYNIYKAKADELDLEWLISLVEEGKLNPEDLPFELTKIAHYNHFIQRIYGSEVLNSFDANIYESLITQYKDLHKEFTAISRNQLIVKLSSNIPNFNQEAAQSSEIGFLQKAIRSKGRGLSLRKLFDNIPNLIPRLKPCMLMSPISVAQYFDVNTDHFDLVIFDEASQLPTAEAVSALARARQAIIVGDPKQMPPTSFFSTSRTDEDNLEMEDLESILEDCLALSIPSNYLLRHYRSKHESLISFSNTHFYDSKLLTFPSPDDLDRKVTFEAVDGFYDKGRTRTNKNEAEAVISYIKNHLSARNIKSLGVVTFSQTQQSLIEDLLQKLFQENPSLEEFAMTCEEPIFIKNLENVQGDERDIILFSIGYGPDDEGKVSMNFGPLNRDGGWRRLNVAVTRARYEMKVFSSLRGDQIDLSRTKSEGMKGLKDFLNFAEKGSLTVMSQSQTNDNDILTEAIANHLEKSGLRVKINIGTSNYKVDIGIIHPEKEDYILGILVDGDNYFNINTTNDRELLAPSVLTGLGWDIFRIWSLDWLKNRDQIVKAIQKQVNEVLDGSKLREKENGRPLDVTDNLNIRTNLLVVAASENSYMIPYKAAEIEAVPGGNSENIYFPENKALILNQMIEIINAEAPVSKSILFRKTMRLWNTSRAGGKLNSYLSQIADELPMATKTVSHQEFYWSERVSPESIKNYRDSSTEKRAIEDIAQEEISVAMMEILNANLSLNKDDLIRLTARAFGTFKVGSQVETVISGTVEKLIEQGKLNIVDNRLTVS